MTADQERLAAEWMRRAQQGDGDAYADLLVLLTGAVRRLARSKVGAVPWVDDVVQETLISVHAARHTYDAARPFAPWFYAIAHRRLIDVLRRERRTGAREVASDALADAAVAADEAAVDVEAIHAALRSLPARQREIIEGLKLQDASVKELSARFGMTESAVKVTAHRGYKLLRRVLGDRT